MSRRGRLSLLAILALLSAAPISSASQAGGRFLIATDIHFNPLADPTLVADLAAADPRHWATILDASKLTAYSQYGEDTNWWLLRSAFDAMHTTVPHPALVMLTGDLLSHGFPQKFATATHDTDREHYRAFVVKTVTFLSWELRKRFPEEQILVTPGNNDDECGDYEIEAEGPFLKETAGLIQDLAGAGEPVGREWSTLGSYSVRPEAFRGLRILSLNTIFFSNRYQSASVQSGCAAGDSTAAATRTFDWLESNLAEAKAAHQKVWLMLHIPPGIDGYATMMKYRQLSRGAASPNICRDAIVPLWKPAWTEEFSTILQNYQGTITAAFAGHDHTDDFRVVNGASSKPGFVLISPPVSPIYGQNPAFRVVTVGKGARLADQATIYMSNLKVAGSDILGAWTQEYDFGREWGSRRIDAVTLRNLYGRVMNDPQARARWLTLLNVSSPDISVPAAGAKVLACAMESLEPAQFQACACPEPPVVLPVSPAAP